jgi:subtilisin-like proprotein convertase family protein
MKKIYFSVFSAALLTTSAFAQVFTGLGNPIIDGQTTTSQITTVGIPQNIDTVYGLEYVKINIAHSSVGDLRVQVQAPNGAIFNLTNNIGGTGDNFVNTIFIDSAVQNIYGGTAPFTGNFKPQGSIYIVNTNQNGNGNWNLLVTDNDNNGQIGTVVNWTLKFSNKPSKPKKFTSSNLPIVLINTFGATIPDEPRIPGRINFIENAPGVRNYVSDSVTDPAIKMVIEQRGQLSQQFDQKSWLIETHDVLDSVLDTTVFGMPAENKWILYGPYNDKTLLRNFLTYHLVNEMGHYASRTRFCEVVLNGQYRGVYIMLEEVKRGDNRVNIAKLDTNDNAGDSLTGGYIIKRDWDGIVQFNSVMGNRFFNHYPKYKITVPQKTYIKAYVDSLETALYSPTFNDPITGYTKYMKVSTFIDCQIINEMMRNSDGYRASLYFYKDKYSKGGQLKSGPAWDYNFGYGLSPWYGANPNGNTGGRAEWCYLDNFGQIDWWDRLNQDSVYQNKVKCRWLWLRSKTLSNSYINNFLDSMANILNESQQRHFEKYPIMGIGCCYNNVSPFAVPTSYQGEIDYLKSWINARFAWIDGNLEGNCTEVGIGENSMADDALVTVYPNPFQDFLNVNYFLNEESKVTIQFVNPLGQIIKDIDCGVKPVGDYNEKIDQFNNLPNGIYLVRVNTMHKTYSNIVVKN